jgi:hypothetical protein
VYLRHHGSELAATGFRFNIMYVLVLAARRESEIEELI